ncbi:MAG: hypothetical protein ACXVZX_15700 [Terriglobales bacterium]
MPQIQDCKRELRRMFLLDQMPGFIEVNAGDLHERVFGAPSHDTPVCCAAMRSELRECDSIVAGTVDELGSAFTVRYTLPRPSPVVQADAQD